jgi:RNA polymerase sigma-70 factor, ECF subfamily
MTDDWHCLDLARGGNETAWRILFHRYYPSLVRIVSCITGSRDTAHDLAQESFVRLIRARVEYQSGSFRAYLTTIAYRLALKERKRQSSKDELGTLPLADDSPSPLDLAIKNDTDRIIFRVIQSLPAEMKEILALRFFGGHSYEEIALITKIPVGTVKSRIFYAIKSCREKLIEQGVFK